jgi:hypothetical protein
MTSVTMQDTKGIFGWRAGRIAGFLSASRAQEHIQRMLNASRLSPEVMFSNFD